MRLWHFMDMLEKFISRLREANLADPDTYEEFHAEMLSFSESIDMTSEPQTQATREILKKAWNLAIGAPQ